MQKGLECGGAYLKLLTENPGEGIRAGEDFTDKTPFTIMFGPVSPFHSIELFASSADLTRIRFRYQDKCGSTNKGKQ